MRKVYFFAAALVATLTGCDNSEMNNITDSKQVAVEVTAGIEGVTTRMKNTTWQSGDEIGVFGTSGKMSYSNYRYQWTSGNAFKPYSNVIIMVMRKVSLRHIIRMLLPRILQIIRLQGSCQNSILRIWTTRQISCMLKQQVQKTILKLIFNLNIK